MTTVPEKIVIVGGGVIGMEFATLFATLGKKVTVNYKNEGNGERRFFVDGKEVESGYDELSDTRYIKIAKADIKGDIVIDVID